VSVWDFNCPNCGQRGRWGTADFPKRGTVPFGAGGGGQTVCECARCRTALRIQAPWFFFGARPHVVSAELLKEAQERERAEQAGYARGRLLEALSRLSAPALEQQEYLESIDAQGYPEELVNEPVDVRELGLDACGVGARGAESLAAIDRQVEEMNEREELWHMGALASAPEWEELRRLARIAADDARRGW
jgi:hypothetical protein